MKTQFGITDGATLTALVNATSIEGAVNIYLKRILRDEYGITPDVDGKLLTAVNLQLAYDDWADTMEENMRNDGYAAGEHVIDLDSMVDNWSNRYWLVEYDVATDSYVGIRNQLQYDLIEAVFTRKGIKKKSFVIEETA